MRVLLAITCAWCLIATGCFRSYRDDLDYEHVVVQTWQVDESRGDEFVQFETVFWEADDTVSLRGLITDDQIANGRDCFEIGTGTGLLSVLCLKHGAKRVVATDINPAAVANARYNAAMLNVDANFEVRQIDRATPGAFSALKPGEQFDLILSNPPWEDGEVHQVNDYAYNDPGFGLMDSILDGLPGVLRPGGRCLLAYGHRPAIERLVERANRLQYQVKLLDDRSLAELPENFLPGFLVEIRCPQKSPSSAGPVAGDTTK